MTLAALEARYLVKGVKGPAYKVGPWCANPNCRRMAEHTHHIIRRSALGNRDFDWIEIDGWVVGNRTGLCVECHEDVTGVVGGHKAAIRIDVTAKQFYWTTVEPGPDPSAPRFINFGLLEPQPPTPELLLSERALGQEEIESEHCPFCGSIKRRRRPSGAGRRRRKSWTVSVPDDAEDGAEILDTFVDDIATMLGAGEWEEHNRRYWALVHGLAWVMQHRGSFHHDVKTAA